MIKPQQDRILVIPDKVKKQSGFEIPDSHNRVPMTGEVYATGPGVLEFPMEAKKGDRVMYEAGSGTPIEHEGGFYLVLRSPDIIAIL